MWLGLPQPCKFWSKQVGLPVVVRLPKTPKKLPKNDTILWIDSTGANVIGDLDPSGAQMKSLNILQSNYKLSTERSTRWESWWSVCLQRRDKYITRPSHTGPSHTTYHTYYIHSSIPHHTYHTYLSHLLPSLPITTVQEPADEPPYM
jgi:hypothetical protein